MNAQPGRPTGMTTFSIVWVGQVLSLLGTAVSNFGLTLWAWEETGEATALALVGFFFTIPMVALNPLVGVLVDKANRKLMMMLSDLAAAATSLAILALYLTGSLEIWHLYVSAFISGSFQAFQWPAYSAAITLMLEKKHYARASAMLEMAGAASHIFAPMVAGALIGVIGLTGLLIADLISATFAIGSLLFVHIPQPLPSAAGEEEEGSFLQQVLFGFRYITARTSLLSIQLFFLIANLFQSMAFAVYAPLILARTGNDEIIFGNVQSAAAFGGLAGGLLMSAWGGFKRRIHGVLLGFIFSSLGLVVLGLGRTVPVWIGAAFFSSIFGPLINGSNQAIWQAKVPPDIQGRVFATRRLIAWLVVPLSQLIAGPLADNVLRPSMQEEGALVPVFDWLVGVGDGAGLGLLFVFAGAGAVLAGLGAYLIPAVRDAESRLPDYDEVADAAA